jgi:plastocyanin
MKRVAIWLSMVPVLALTACGGGDEAGTPTSPPGATTDSPSPTATEASGETRIAMQDNVFQPNTLTVASGAELELDNEGQNPHTFTIDGEDVDTQVNAGENAKVTLDLAAGTYDFVCRFHQSLGMTGTLTVS